MLSQPINKIKTRPIPTSPIQTNTYLESLTLGLIGYAHEDTSFSDWLIKKIPQRSAKLTPAVLPTSTILAPLTITAAQKKAGWLFTKIAEGNLPGTAESLALLTVWAKTRSMDKPQVVVGVTATSIPGLTIGKFKTKTETMTIILREDIDINSTINLSAAITRSSLDVLAQSFKMTSGYINELEPEVGQWFFEDRGLTLFTASATAMQKIQQELNLQHIPHNKTDLNNQIAILAISPAVSNIYQLTHWNITPAAANL